MHCTYSMGKPESVRADETTLYESTVLGFSEEQRQNITESTGNGLFLLIFYCAPFLVPCNMDHKLETIVGLDIVQHEVLICTIHTVYFWIKILRLAAFEGFKVSIC